MHIPENYLSPSTCAVMTAAVAPAWGYSIYQLKKKFPPKKLPMLGIGAAFSFLLMMFNLPLPGGTTGHAVGAVLLAILFGPEAACLSVSVALLLQALLFGDGGILAFGANCFNMAFVMPFAGYAIYRFLKDKLHFRLGESVAAAVAAWVGLNAAALCASFEFGLQPLLFHDAAGNALYCPYDLSIAIPAMMLPHMAVAGVAEALFTVAILAFVKKSSPDLLPQQTEKKRSWPVFVLLGCLIAAVPLGLLAEGDAWGEWGLQEIAEQVGYTPSGMANGLDFTAWMPDYSIAGLPEWLGYLLSAVAGIAILLILFKLLGLLVQRKKAA